MDQFDERRLAALLGDIRTFLAARRALEHECRAPDPLPENPHPLQAEAHRRQAIRQTPVDRLHYDLQKSDPYPKLIDTIVELTAQCTQGDSGIFSPGSEFGQLFKRVVQRVQLAYATRRAFKKTATARRWLSGDVFQHELIARAPMPDLFEWLCPTVDEMTEEERRLFSEVDPKLDEALAPLAQLTVHRESLALPLLDQLEALVRRLLNGHSGPTV